MDARSWRARSGANERVSWSRTAASVLAVTHCMASTSARYRKQQALASSNSANSDSSNVKHSTATAKLFYTNSASHNSFSFFLLLPFIPFLALCLAALSLCNLKLKQISEYKLKEL
jgi:hypothetical protein